MLTSKRISGLSLFSALARISKSLAYILKFLALSSVDFGEGEIQLFERIDYRSRNNQPGEPFVVGRHDKPRSVFGASVSHHILIGFHVIIPILTFVSICGGKLPILGGVILLFYHPPLSDIHRDVQEEFSY